MKLSISKSELQRGLGRIQTIVEKRNTMPILANVHLAAVAQPSPGTLELAATDLEVGVQFFDVFLNHIKGLFLGQIPAALGRWALVITPLRGILWGIILSPR